MPVSFSLESFTELDLRSLDGDDAVEAGVAGFPNLTHSARSGGREQLVRSEFVARRERHVLDLA